MKSIYTHISAICCNGELSIAISDVLLDATPDADFEKAAVVIPVFVGSNLDASPSYSIELPLANNDAATIFKAKCFVKSQFLAFIEENAERCQKQLEKIQKDAENLQRKYGTQVAPDALDKSLPWSYQVDGQCMDITTPTDLMVRLIKKGNKMEVSVLPFSESDSLSPDAHTATFKPDAEVDMSKVELEVSATEPHRAYICLNDEDKCRIDINATYEGVLVDVWMFMDLEGYRPELVAST